MIYKDIAIFVSLCHDPEIGCFFLSLITTIYITMLKIFRMIISRFWEHSLPPLIPKLCNSRHKLPIIIIKITKKIMNWVSKNYVIISQFENSTTRTSKLASLILCQFWHQNFDHLNSWSVNWATTFFISQQFFQWTLFITTKEWFSHCPHLICHCRPLQQSIRKVIIQKVCSLS